MQICCCLFSSGSDWSMYMALLLQFYFSLPSLKTFKFVCWLSYFSRSIWLLDVLLIYIYIYIFSICNCFLIFLLNFKEVWINFQGTLSSSGVYSMHIIEYFLSFVQSLQKNWVNSWKIFLFCVVDSYYLLPMVRFPLHEFFSPRRGYIAL